MSYLSKASYLIDSTATVESMSADDALRDLLEQSLIELKVGGDDAIKAAKDIIGEKLDAAAIVLAGC
jgi:hypothetical protein